MKDEWLYYKLYPGGFGRLDEALAALATLVERHTPSIRRWFFIRYVDEVGPHLRFRVLPEPDRVAHLHQALWAATAGWLAERAPPAQPRTWLTVEDKPRHPYSSTTKALELAVYEPECKKYGGVRGVELAEQIFQVSSTFVLRATGRGSSDGLTRAAIARAVMVPLVDGCMGSAAGEFWSQYAGYWLRGVRADHLSMEVSEARRDVKAVADLLQAAWSEGPTGADLDRERDAYVAAVHQYLEQATADTGRPLHALLFHQVHMTNNRLGLSPVEESIVALPLATSEAA